MGQSDIAVPDQDCDMSDSGGADMHDHADRVHDRGDCAIRDHDVGAPDTVVHDQGDGVMARDHVVVAMALGQDTSGAHAEGEDVSMRDQGDNVSMRDHDVSDVQNNDGCVSAKDRGAECAHDQSDSGMQGQLSEIDFTSGFNALSIATDQD